MGAAHGDRLGVAPDPFAAFYDKAFGEVYRYLSHGVLGNRALAEDLTQETFAAIAGALDAGRAEAQSMPWVMGVARHKLIDHYRHCEGQRKQLALAWVNGYGHEDGQIDDLDGADLGRVVELLAELSPIHRLVLALRYLDDLSVDEIAAAIGRSVRATESLLVRARRALTRSVQENVS
jgi:RNA polymerase sigma-70 factor (ECF subfamily)